MSAEKNTPISFGFTNLLGKDSFVDGKSYAEGCVVDADFEVQFLFEYAKRRVALTCGAAFSCGEKIFAQFTITNEVRIDEHTWSILSQNETQDVVLPRGFVAYILDVSMSALRGYAAAKIEGTSLEGRFVFPFVDTSEKMQKEDDASFVMEKPKVDGLEML